MTTPDSTKKRRNEFELASESPEIKVERELIRASPPPKPPVRHADMKRTREQLEATLKDRHETMLEVMTRHWSKAEGILRELDGLNIEQRAGELSYLSKAKIEWLWKMKH